MVSLDLHSIGEERKLVPQTHNLSPNCSTGCAAIVLLVEWVRSAVHETRGPQKVSHASV